MNWKKKKMKKYKAKKILFFDTENIGGWIPEDDDFQAILFTSQFTRNHEFKNYLRKQDEIVEIGKEYTHTKNLLDFILITKLMEVLNQTKNNQKLYIISRDSGFDGPIQYLNSQYPNREIKRYDSYSDLLKNKTPMSHLIKRTPPEIITMIERHNLLNKLSECDSMQMLRKLIPVKIYRKVFILRSYKDLSVQFDFYEGKTFLIHGGKTIYESKIVGKVVDRFTKECLERYQICITGESLYLNK